MSHHTQLMISTGLPQSRFTGGPNAKRKQSAKMDVGITSCIPDTLDPVVFEITTRNKAFVRNVKRLNKVKRSNENTLRHEFSGIAEKSLQAFINYQAKLVKMESNQEVEEDDIDLSVSCENSVESYTSTKDNRLPPGELAKLKDKKTEVVDQLQNSLGGSPRGMTIMQSISSPKRENRLQHMLEQPLWTDVHERAYQEFRRKRQQDMRERQAASSKINAQILMSSFLLLNEFRQAHVEAVRRIHLHGDIRKKSGKRARTKVNVDASYKTVSMWRQCKEMLNEHNKHFYETSTKWISDGMRPQDIVLAKQEVADYVVRSRQTYIREFLKKREEFLMVRIQKQRAKAAKRSKRMNKAFQMQDARERMRIEIKRTRRRLKNMERKPKEIVEAKRRTRYHERCHIKKPLHHSHSISDKRHIDSGTDLELMTKVTERYCKSVLTHGGGVPETHQIGSQTLRTKRLASLRIQAAFRGRLARRYLFALSWVNTPFHLNIALKRAGNSDNTIDFKFVPQLFEDLGRKKIESSEIGAFHRELSPNFEDKISLDTVREHFLKTRERNPTPADLIRLVYSVNALIVKEEMLLNNKSARKRRLSKSLRENALPKLAQVSRSNTEATLSTVTSKDDDDARRVQFSSSDRKGSSSSAPEEPCEKTEKDKKEKENPIPQVLQDQLERERKELELKRLLEEKEARKASKDARMDEKEKGEYELQRKRERRMLAPVQRTPRECEEDDADEIEKFPKDVPSGDSTPQWNAKLYKERIEINRLLAKRLEQRRQALRVASRQLSNEKMMKELSYRDGTGNKKKARPVSAPAARVELNMSKAFQEYEYGRYLIDLEEKTQRGEEDQEVPVLSFEEFQAIQEHLSEKKGSLSRLYCGTLAGDESPSPWQPSQFRLKTLKKHVSKDLRAFTYSRTLPLSKMDSKTRKAHLRNKHIKKYLENVKPE